MATIMLNLKKEDINTAPIGFNYRITVANGMEIVIDDDAVDELIKDVQGIRKIKGGANKCFMKKHVAIFNKKFKTKSLVIH